MTGQPAGGYHPVTGTPGCEEDGVPRSHPLASIAIDPRKLSRLMRQRALTRAELSRRISALGWDERTGEPLDPADPAAEALVRGVNAIAKYETGERNPKGIAFRALLAVLHAGPEDLLYDGPLLEIPETEVWARYVAQLREFAGARGIEWNGPTRELREAFMHWAAFGDDAPDDPISYSVAS